MEIERASAVLTVESDRRAINPLPKPAYSPNTSNINFEIDSLFSVVEKSGNYVFEDDKPPPIVLCIRF